MDSLFFLVIGNFISCCYSRNFTVFELLRRPIEFPCTRQENYFVSKIPKGLPWQDFVLSIEGQFLSKLKDIGVQKGIKSADDKNDFIFFDIAPIESSLSFDERVKLGQGKLIYSPWFRFVVEPMDFNNIYEKSEYLINCFQYICGRNSIKTNRERLSENETLLILESEYHGIQKICVEFDSTVKKIELIGSSSNTSIDFVSKVLCFGECHSKIIFDALRKLESNALKNIRIRHEPLITEMSYEQ